MEERKGKIRKLENHFGKPNIVLTRAQEKEGRDVEKRKLSKKRQENHSRPEGAPALRVCESSWAQWIMKATLCKSKSCHYKASSWTFRTPEIEKSYKRPTKRKEATYRRPENRMALNELHKREQESGAGSCPTPEAGGQRSDSFRCQRKWISNLEFYNCHSSKILRVFFFFWRGEGRTWIFKNFTHPALYPFSGKILEGVLR